MATFFIVVWDWGPRISRIGTNLLIYTKKKVKVKVKVNVDLGFAMVGGGLSQIALIFGIIISWEFIGFMEF